MKTRNGSVGDTSQAELQTTKIIVLSARQGVVRTGFNAKSVTAGFTIDAPVFLWIFSPI